MSTKVTIADIFDKYVRVVPEADVREQATLDAAAYQKRARAEVATLSQTERRGLDFYRDSPHLKPCPFFASGDMNVVTRVGPYKEARNFADIDMSVHHSCHEFQICDGKWYFGKSQNMARGGMGGGTRSGAVDLVSCGEHPTGGISFPTLEQEEKLKAGPSQYYSVCAFTNKNVESGPPLCLMIDQRVSRLIVKYRGLVLVDLDEIGLNLFKKNDASLSPYRCYWNRHEFYNQPIMLTVGKINRDDFVKNAYIGVKINGVKITDIKDAVFVDGDIDHYVISKPCEEIKSEDYKSETKDADFKSEQMRKFVDSDAFGKFLFGGELPAFLSESGKFVSKLMYAGGDPATLPEDAIPMIFDGIGGDKSV